MFCKQEPLTQQERKTRKTKTVTDRKRQYNDLHNGNKKARKNKQTEYKLRIVVKESKIRRSEKKYTTKDQPMARKENTEVNVGSITEKR